MKGQEGELRVREAEAGRVYLNYQSVEVEGECVIL